MSIYRANYAFRLVPVPAGESTVVFRYRPTSVRLGAAISLISILGLVGYGIVRALRRRAGSGENVRVPDRADGSS